MKKAPKFREFIAEAKDKSNQLRILVLSFASEINSLNFGAFVIIRFFAYVVFCL